MEAKVFLLVPTPEDQENLFLLKPYFTGCNVKILNRPILTAIETYAEAKKVGAEAVISTSPTLLHKVLGFSTGASLDDFAGSIVDFKGMEYLFLNPLQQLHSVSYGKFLCERYLSKFTAPNKWFAQTPFLWEVANESTIGSLYSLFTTADFIAIDTETTEGFRFINCVSYTGVWYSRDGYTTKSIVLPINAMFWIVWMRKFNSLPSPKILQNGKYDHAYFYRANAPVHNWQFDTLTLFHSWYSELPKRLDFLASFSLRRVQFWKDEGKTGNIQDHYRYCARDGWATANAFLSIMSEAPAWALSNYQTEFPLNFPCHLAEMVGIAGDVEQITLLHEQQSKIESEKLRNLEKMVGVGFNPGSPPQVKRLLEVLGSKDIKSTTEKDLRKAMFRHPLNTRILNEVIEVRKARKLLSTYLDKDKYFYDSRQPHDNTKLRTPRIFYTLNPHGTDTARLASAESHFWCGFQIHNTPRNKKDIKVKSHYVAEPEFYFGEGDYSQAEARDTAYLSGDPAMLEAVESPRDFHSVNVERFFGLPYSSIYNDDTKEVLNEEIRDISKRTNHGAGYNMQWAVLIDTMGLERIFEAKKLLNLPKFWNARNVAQYLLDSYDKAYPTVRKEYYEYIKYTIKLTHRLVSPLGWTRFCFGNPEKNRQHLNAYVAHPSQNLNAGTLNKAWMRVYTDVALAYPRDFRLCAQIHDSILFQYRIGHDHLVGLVYRSMLFDVKVRDRLGIERILRVPVSMKAGASRWSEVKKWNE